MQIEGKNFENECFLKFVTTEDFSKTDSVTCVPLWCPTLMQEIWKY